MGNGRKEGGNGIRQVVGGKVGMNESEKGNGKMVEEKMQGEIKWLLGGTKGSKNWKER